MKHLLMRSSERFAKKQGAFFLLIGWYLFKNVFTISTVPIIMK